MLKQILLLFFLSSTTIYSQTITPNPMQYHKVVLEYTSTATYNETQGNALFRNIRLNVTFTSPTGQVFIVAGYFAGDGNAANTSASTGNKWRVNFTPTEIGRYTYVTSFRQGNDVILDLSVTAGTPFDFNATNGNFTTIATNKSGLDFRSKGVLRYVNDHFFRWSNGDYFLEFGADSPEVFLEYNDFDNTPDSQGRTYPAHLSEWQTGDPQWKTNQGRSIIGVVNHLSNAGMNVHYFLTMNSFGDGQSAYPWTGNNTTNQFDVSKLAQWEIVFDHMMAKGVMPEFVLGETENQQLFEDNEGIVGGFANTRKLYYREMVARFGYLNAAVWNIGEEQGWDQGSGRMEAVNNQQLVDFAAYLKTLLPRKNEPITVHNGPSTTDAIFTGLLGNANYNNISFQGNYQTTSFGHDRILFWRNQSAIANKKWVVRYTEPYVGAGTDQAIWRKNSLWASLTAGGAGVQYYDGGGRDVTAQDYNTYQVPYLAMKIAKDFFENNNVPFFEMSNNDAATSTGWMLSKANSSHVIYLPNGGTTVTANLGSTGEYTIKWYDPRNGGALQNGSITSITADGTNKSIGNPPNNNSSDWVVLLENGGTPTGSNISINNTTVVEGSNAVLTVTLDNAISGGFTVDYTTQNSTATSGADYTTNSGTLTFSGTAGETRTISITTLDDATPESIEQFFVNLTNATNGVTITNNQAVVTLTDNDSSGCDATYNEVNGLVIIEAENLTLNTGWSIGATKTGFTGAGYITYTGSPSFSTPGNNPITATIKINNPGTYLFEWRNTIGVTGTTTDDNDTWVRFNDASEFFATRGGNTIFPQGSGQTPVVNGTGGSNWFKIYANNQAWTWQTNTNDNVPYEIYVRFDTPGTYSMELSARSANHFIDRITLSNAGGNRNLALTETLCASSPVGVIGVEVTPETGTINIGNTLQLNRSINPSNATNQSGTWSSSATGVATVNSNGLVIGVSEGTTTITYSTTDGGFTDTAIITVIAQVVAAITINDITIEEGDTASFTVTLDNAVPGGFSVNYSTQNNTATSVGNADFTASNGTLNFSGTAGETQTINIATTDDAVVEATERFFVNLSNASNDVTIADSRGIATITDNDDLEAAIRIDDITVTEGNIATFTVTLDDTLSGGFTVNYRTVNNSATAIANADFIASNGTLTFAGTAGETQSISIITTDDAAIEASERFFVDLSNATNGVVIADNRGVATIADNDLPASVRIGNVSVTEGTDAIFTLTLDNPVSGGFTLDFTTQDNSAIAGDDYTGLAGELTFLGTAGETQTITVATIDDAIVEANERFFVALSNASNSVSIADNQGVATITDNDAFASITINNIAIEEGQNAVFTVTLDNTVTGGFSVDFNTLDNTATANIDYTPNNGTLTFSGTAGETQIITVATIDDILTEPTEDFFVNLSNATNSVTIADSQGIGTITSNDESSNIVIDDITIEEGGNAIFTVRLDNALPGGFSVNFSTQNNSATSVGNADFIARSGTLNFSGIAGETRTIQVTTIDDTNIEANERFFVNLNNATNGVTIQDSRGIATITDNDDPESSISINDISVEEGDDAVFTVTLNNAISGGFSVNYSSQNNSATSVGNSDFIATNGMLNFSGVAGETQTITVTTVDDNVVEANERFFMNLTNSTNGVLIADSRGIATINDNDIAITSRLTINNITIVEGSDAVFTITLDNEVNGGFTIDYTTENNSAVSGTDFTAANGTVFFEGSEGETKTITIQTIDDNAIEVNEQFFLNLSNATNGVTIAKNQGVATITDNDVENISSLLAIDDVSALEGEDLVFNISLNAPAEENLVLTFSFLNETTSDVDYEITPVQLAFGVGEINKELRISTFEDGEVESEETFLLQIASIDEGQISNPEVTARATIIDNTSTEVLVYPVPLKIGNDLIISGLNNGSFILAVFSMSKKRIFSQVIVVSDNKYILNTRAVLSSGVYLLNLSPIGSGEVIIKKIIFN